MRRWPRCAATPAGRARRRTSRRSRSPVLRGREPSPSGSSRDHRSFEGGDRVGPCDRGARAAQRERRACPHPGRVPALGRASRRPPPRNLTNRARIRSLRAQRRCPHRIPDGWRRATGHRLDPGLGVEPRAGLGAAGLRGLPAASRRLQPPDPARQAGDRPLGSRPGGRAADARGADGRCQSRDGRRRVGAGSAVRRLRGRTDVCTLRRDVS